jgi:phosphatidylserine decarboxylase
VADRAVGIPLAKEGFPFVGILAGATIIAGLLGWTVPALIAGLLTFFTAWFFRNPARVVPQGAKLIVATGDGKVVAVEEEFEPRFLKEKCVRVSVFLNVFDVHINRTPCEGVVEQVQYLPGEFLVASKPGATLKNEQNAVVIRTPQGVRIVSVQVAGLIARRIVCWLSQGEQVKRGERYGLIRFGSRMDTFLPTGSVVKVAVGDRVKGGETVIGVLP